MTCFLNGRVSLNTFNEWACVLQSCSQACGVTEGGGTYTWKGLAKNLM